MFLENRELIGYGNVEINTSLYSERSFIKTALSGDFGLAKTFWLYLFAVAIFFNIGIVMFSEFSIEVLSVLLLMVSTAYSLPLHIAIWRAANKYRGPKIWPILAKLSVKVHIFAFIWAIFLSVLLVYIDNYLSHV